MSTLTLQFEGTNGNNVTFAAEGASGSTGAGTMVYSTGGLFPGSSIKAVVTGARVLRVDDALFDMDEPVLWVQIPFRVPSTFSGGNAKITKWRDSANDGMAIFSIRDTDGKAVLTYTGGPNVVSVNSYSDNAVYWVQHLVDQDNETQTAYLYAASGLLLETIVGPINISNPIVNCQIGSQDTGAGTVIHIDRTTFSHDQPSVVPDGSGVAATYTIQGTDGDPITVASEGADGMVGAGTAVYDTGGLVSGSTIHGVFTGSRFLRTDAAFGPLIDMRMAIQVATPTTAAVALLQGGSADGEAQGSVWLKSSGKLELRFAGGNGLSDWVATDVTVHDDKPYWLLFQIRQDDATQTLFVVDADSGKIMDEVSTAVGTAAITEVKTGPANGPDATVVLIDEITVATIPLSVPGAFSDPLKYAVVGAATPTDVTISVRAPGASAVRALISGDQLKFTAQATPDVSGRAFLTVPALSATRLYSAQVEMFDGSDWSTAGDPISWVQPIPTGEIGTQLIAVLACQASKAQVLDNYAYDDLLAYQQNGAVTIVVWNGDQHYGNVTTDDPADHIAKIDNILDELPGMRRQHMSARMVRKSSDHDGGGGNNVFFHGDAILASKEATREIYPQYGPVTTDPATDYEIWQEGRVLHIALDCRSNYRSEHDEVESGTKTCLGLDQRAAVIAALTTARPADVRVIVIYSDMGWLGTGFDQTKPDAWSWYPTERDLIEDAAVACPYPVFMMQGDWHTMVWADPDQGAQTRGMALVGGFAGTQRSTGNFAKMFPFMTGEYTGIHPPMADDGTQPVIDIWQYGLLKIVDTGPKITVTMIGRDARNHVDIVRITKTYDVDDPHAGEPALIRLVSNNGGVYDLLEDPTRSSLRPATALFNLPGRELGLASRGGGGAQLVGAITQPGRALLSVRLRPTPGTPPGGLEGLMGPRDSLYGQAGGTRELTLQVGPYAGGEPTREIQCIVGSASSSDDVDGVFEDHTLAIDTLEPSWRDTVLSSVAFGLTNDVINQEILAARDSTADIPDALVRLRGPGNYFRAIDAATGCGFHWRIPGLGTPLAEGQYAIVDCVNWTTYLLDHESWDPAEGVEWPKYMIPLRDRYDPSGVLLPLTPVLEADGIWRVRMTIQSKETSGATQFAMRFRRRFR